MRCYLINTPRSENIIFFYSFASFSYPLFQNFDMGLSLDISWLKRRLFSFMFPADLQIINRHRQLLEILIISRVFS